MAGQNLALIGNELIQFLRADLIGPSRYRLSGLLRGRRGSEWAMADHNLSDPFVLIESDSLLALTIPEGTATVLASASGIGDAVPAEATRLIEGNAVRSIAPTLLRSKETVTGDILFDWVRRSRDGWRWVDFVDAPLAEESDRYEVTTKPQPGLPRSMVQDGTHYTYSAAERAADMSAGAIALQIEVRQIGTYGPSRPASITMSLL